MEATVNGRKLACLVLWLLLLFGYSHAENSCKKGCGAKSENGLLKYAPGTTYEYNYDSILTIKVATTTTKENDDVGLKVSGSAKIYVEGNCDYILQLNEMKINALKEGNVDKRILATIEKPVHFKLVNGFVEPEICVDNADDIYSVNIKRAIISMFHASTEKENIVEVDVFGKCPTHTTVTKAGNLDVITKVRNLNNCAYRQHIVSGIINGVFDENSNIKSSMLLQADYAKEVQIQNGIIQDISLVEDYFLVGTPKSSSDARAKIVTNMKLNTVTNGPAPTKGGNQPASVIFKKPSLPGTENRVALKSAINEIVQANNDYVQKGSAKKIGELIRLMRNSDTDSLLELASVPFPNKILARKVYLDALFRTATPQSAKAILKQLNQSKFNDVEKAMALFSLNLVQVVDRETIAVTAALLGPAAPNEAFLAAGNLLAKYCKEIDCENDPEAQKLTQTFTGALKRCEAVTKKDEDRLIFVLKGITNSKKLSKSVIPTLLECASPGRSLRLRVAALKAYSVASCDGSIHKNTLKLLRDYNEDSELRIEAYLAAIECPNAELANELSDIINNEKIYQVGGFMASHLRSIRDSTDLHRESLRYYLGNVRVTQKFPHDIRRYSYNNELSYRLDALGVGASVDHRVIYSQKGFLPRSARLNVTSELFGMNFNLLEANLRQENLESLLETYFGPKGVVNENFDKISDISGAADDAPPRRRRSIADDASTFARKYKTRSANENDLNLDLSIKFFGSEMFFLSLGDNVPIKLDDIIQTLSTSFDKLKNEVSNFQKELTMHSLFIDTEFMYPTSIGMPFEVSAQGFAASKIDFGLGIDIDALMAQNWQSAKYKLKIVPSVDANINFRLSFNAYVLSTGCEYTISLHSATGADTMLEFGNENEFSLDIKLPREKIELLDVETSFQFYIAEQNKEKKIFLPKGISAPNMENSNVCFDQFSFIGFTVCFYLPQSEEHGYSVVHPQKAGLYIISEKHYKIKGQHTPENSDVKQWSLEFSTPGSAINHDSSLTIQLGVTPRTFARLSVKYPGNELALEAGINNDGKESVLYTQYEQNDQRSRSRIGFEKNGNEYRPVISLQESNGQIKNDINGYRADGRVIVQQKGENSKRYNFEQFKISNNEKNQRLVLNGWVDVGSTDMSAEMNVRPGDKGFTVTCHYKIDNGLYEISTFIADEKKPNNIYGGSVNIKVADNLVDVSATGKGHYWELFTKAHVDYVQAEDSDTPISANFQGDITAKHKGKNYGSISVDGSVSGKTNCAVNVKLTQGKNIGTLSTKVETNKNAERDFLVEINGKLNKNFVDIISKCDVSNNQYKLENILTTSWGTAFTLKGQLGQRFTAQDVLIDLYGTAQLSSKNKPSQWILKVNGSPEKTLSEFKVNNNENQEFIKYNGEISHPQDKNVNGKFNLMIKNSLNTKADYKVGKNGKGELNAHIDLLRTDAKHKIELASKFHIQSPKYDMEASIIFDNNKKVFLKTENQLDKSKFSTKNTVEFGEKKISLDINAQTKGSDWRSNGELAGSFDCKLPSGYSFDGSIASKMTTNPKTGLGQGHVDIILNEQNNGKKRSLNYNGKLEKLNLKSKEISLDSKVTYMNEESKSLNINANVKHLSLDNEKYKLEIKVKSDGNAFSLKPVQLSLLLSEYDTKHAEASLKGKYGTNIQGSINGKFELGKQPGSPFVYNVQTVLQAPETDFKSFELNSSGKYIKSENKEGKQSHELDLLIEEKLGNGQFIKLQTSSKGGRQHGSYNLNVETDKMPTPLKVNGAYHREHAAANKRNDLKRSFSGEISYNNKYMKTSGDVGFEDKDTFKLHYLINSNLEAVQSIDLTVLSKNLNSESKIFNAEMKLNDQNYALNTELDYSSHKKGLSIDLSVPTSPKHIIVQAVIEKLGESKGRLVGKISNLAGLDIDCKFDAAFSNLDDFYVSGSWNSERLQLTNYVLDVKSKDKVISINLGNNEGVILTGNIAYALKKEGNKSLVEGQGGLQYKGTSQNANFKLIRQIHNLESDKEIGVSYTFNGNFGPKNGVSTFKLTNKEFNVKVSICEEKKQCNNVQLQSLVSNPEGGTDNIIEPFDSTQHSLLILLDFRQLGYPYEFELQSKTVRNGFQIQYNLDSSIVSNSNRKYQLIVNVVPTSSKVQIRLPSRDIVMETISEYPVSGIFGKYKHSAVFYSDKARKPNEAIKFESLLHISSTDNSLSSLNTKSEIRFEHPNMRPLSINGKLDVNGAELLDAELSFDVFKNPEQKITVLSKIQNLKQGKGFNITANHQVRSSALALQYELSGHGAFDIEHHELSISGDFRTGQADANANIWLYAKPGRFELNLNALNQPIMQVNGDLSRKNRNAKVYAKLELFVQKSLELTAKVQPTSATFEVKQGNLANGIIDIKLGKEMTFHMDGAGSPLFDGKIALDGAHFLETTYTSNEENIKRYSDTLESDVKEQTEKSYQQLKQRLQKLQEYIGRQKKSFEDSLPDFEKLTSTYSTNFKEIADELQQDPALREILNAHQELFHKIAKLTENLTSTLLETYQHLQKSASALYDQCNQILSENIVPALEHFLTVTTQIVADVYGLSARLTAETIKLVLIITEKYGEILRNYIKVFNDVIKPYSEGLEEVYKVLTEAIDEIYNEFSSWIAQLPTLDAVLVQLKSNIGELHIRETLLQFLNVLFEQIQVLPTTPEAEKLWQRLHDYLVDKLNGKQVNDVEVAGELLKLLSKVIRSLMSSIQLSLPISTYGSTELNGYFSLLSHPLDFVSYLPGLFSVRFSILNFLFNEDWAAILSRDNLRSIFYFHDFTLRGDVADGHHIFSFDGQYNTFPGSCKYILAQDSVDNNFTIVVQLNNGKLKTIVLSDKEGNYLEVNDNGSLKYNGNALEYPLHEDSGMHAWRNIYTVWLLSEYGVEIMCTEDLKVCHVKINGFYTSKVRGLLGNGNGEPYDDFLKADGKIAADLTSFANGYSLGKCNAVKQVVNSETTARSEICNEIFALDSSLAYAYLLKNSLYYRQACDIAVAEANEKDKESAACNVALTYASAVALEYKFSMLPKRCLKCHGSPQQRDLYSEFTVKVPNNKADIVFVVDVDIEPAVMSNLVAPAVTTIRDSLKARGLNDVQIGVVAYNQSLKYPAYLTSDNGNLNYNGNLALVKLNGPKTFCSGCLSQLTSDKYFLEVLDIFDSLLRGITPQSDEMAFELALKYPFRAGAAKSIVDVRSSNGESKNMLKFVRASIAEAVTKLDGLILHLLSPVKDMGLEGVTSEKLIGFNSRLVATLDGKDAKKRQKLLYDNDLGIDMTLNSGGWVFSTQNFENLKPNEQKKALNQVTNSIADTLFKTETVSDCRCLPVYGLHAQHFCVVKSSSFVPNKKFKA